MTSTTPSPPETTHHITPSLPRAGGAHEQHPVACSVRDRGQGGREFDRQVTPRGREDERRQPQGENTSNKRFCGRSSSGVTAAPARVDMTGLSVSPATGLSGLRESRYLSTFLECYTGMYPLVNNASIREGLLHQFVKLSQTRHQRKPAPLPSQQQPQQQLQQQRPQPKQQNGAVPPPPDTVSTFEAMRGRALSCALFSCMAIGALVEGSPLTSVEVYTTAARRCLPEFERLSDKSAVSALVLYAIASEFSSGRGAGTGYRKGMDAAKAVFERLPGKQKDPVISATLAHLTVLEGFPLLKFVQSSCSVNPANHGGGGGGSNGKNKRKSSGGSGDGGSGGKSDRGVGHGSGNSNSSSSSSSSVGGGHTDDSLKTTSYMSADTATEELKLQRAVASREPVSITAGQPAPPVYVAADALLLGIRFSRDRGDVTTRLWHLHDFASSELDRFRNRGVGAVALLALCGSLLGVKIRLGAVGEGLLATARLSAALIRECPGLVRIYHRHAVHLSMATFRVHGCRKEYEDLRRLMAVTVACELPAFDDLGPQGGLCSMHVCSLHAKTLLLSMPVVVNTTTEAPSTGADAGGSGSGDRRTGRGTAGSDGANHAAAASPDSCAAVSSGGDADVAIVAGSVGSAGAAGAGGTGVKKEDPLLEEGAKLLSGLR